MDSRYAFSLDGNLYRGSFPSRKEARIAGFDAAAQMPEPPGVIFVGRVHPVDPQTANHARHILQEMNRRFRDVTGETRYLSDLTDTQRHSLDQHIDQALRAWLETNNLLPHGQRIESISEYPLPLQTRVPA